MDCSKVKVENPTFYRENLWSPVKMFPAIHSDRFLVQEAPSSLDAWGSAWPELQGLPLAQTATADGRLWTSGGGSWRWSFLKMVIFDIFKMEMFHDFP